MNDKKYKAAIVDYPNAAATERAEMEIHLAETKDFICRVEEKKKAVVRKIPRGVILTTRPDYWDETVNNQLNKVKSL